MKRHAIAIALSVGPGLAVAANQVDPTAEVLKRLKSSQAATQPGGLTLSAVKLKGDIYTDGIKFTLPTVVPEKPLVLMQQRLSNCNDRESTLTASVNKTTENSETFSKSTTLGGSTTVEVSYESPIGLSGSASQTFDYSNTSTEEKTYSESVSWDSGISVPVGPKSALVVQFVVSEQKLNNIPWSTNAIVRGPAELTYDQPKGQVKVCAFEHTSYGGKKKCWTTSDTLRVPNFKDVGWESGKGNLNDEITGFTVEGNAKVTFFQHRDYGGWRAEYSGSVHNVGKDRNDEFSSVIIESLPGQKVVTANLETYLNEQQRRIALNGVYNGVNGVQGDFRAGAPLALSDADCGLVARAGSGGKPAVAAMSAGKPMTKAEPMADLKNVQPIQGKVLQSGVKPKARQVIQTSTKKK